MSNEHPPSSTPMILERYEMKFTIPESLVAPISEFASIYCSLDKHSEAVPGHYYRINNLYFDTPDFLFLRRRREGCENRFNMRIRSYSDTEPLPCFFEIKQRRHTIIKKYRSQINDPHWAKIFEEPGYTWDDENQSGICTSNKDLFVQLAYSYLATPKVFTQYRRKAYVSNVDDYARVTFDRELRYRPTQGYSLLTNEAEMTPLDNSTLFNPGACIILELKCYASLFPYWMIDLIRTFDLQRRSFSKYITGVSEIIQRYEYGNFDRASSVHVNK